MVCHMASRWAPPDLTVDPNPRNARCAGVPSRVGQVVGKRGGRGDTHVSSSLSRVLPRTCRTRTGPAPSFGRGARSQSHGRRIQHERQAEKEVALLWQCHGVLQCVAVCCSVLQSRVRFEELEDVLGDARQDATCTRIQISLDRSRGTHMNESWHTCDESRDMVAVATNLRETRDVLQRGRATQIQWVSGRAMLKQQPLLLPHSVAAATVAAATSCCCCCNSCCCNREEQQKLLLRQGLVWLSDRGRSWRWWGGDAEKGDTEDSDDWMTTCGQRLVLWLPHTHTHTHAHTHTHTQNYIHTHVHAHTHTNTHTRTCTHCTHTRKHAHTPTHARTHTQKQIHMHTHTCTHVHPHARTRTHTHTHT